MKLNDKQKDDLWTMAITVIMVGFFAVMAVLSFLGK